VTSAVRGTKLIVAAVLVVLAWVSGCAGQPEQQAARPSRPTAPAGPEPRTRAPAPAAAAAVGGDGSYRTAERQVTFTEPARTGPADQYLGQRTLVIQVRYPRARGPGRPFPLLLFAPGFLQCPGAYSDLLQAWASAGYVVAAVNFPRTNCHLGTEAYEPDLVNQPQDMSYVLTRLLALSARPGDSFSGLLDPHEVGAAGQSDSPVRAPRSIVASLFGGRLIGDGWATLGPDPRYSINATLLQADLGRCAQEVANGRQRVQGKIVATADLTGSGWGRNALAGRGMVRLSEADVYELPVMVSLLKILSIRPPDQHAFSDATMNYRVEGGHIYFDRIDFRGDAISLRGKGEMDFQSAIRLTFYALVGRGDWEVPVLKQVFHGASQQLMLIHVDGTLQSPQTSRETLPALNHALQQIRDELSRK